MTGLRNRFSAAVQQAKRIAALLSVWGALLGWHLTADRLGCSTAAAVLALAAGVSALAGTEVAFYRRRAFVSRYLEPRGLLFRLLGGRTLILIGQGVRSLLLAFILLIGALSFETAQWQLLLVDIFVFSALLAAFSSLLSGEVRGHYRQPIVRHWAGRTNAVLLWLAWALLMYFSPAEDFSDLRWEEVIAFSAARPAVGCDALALLARFAAVAEALAMWGAQHLFIGLKEPAQVLIAWAIFLAAFGASFLIAWAYSRTLVGALARPWDAWRQRDE